MVCPYMYTLYRGACYISYNKSCVFGNHSLSVMLLSAVCISLSKLFHLVNYTTSGLQFGILAPCCFHRSPTLNYSLKITSPPTWIGRILPTQCFKSLPFLAPLINIFTLKQFRFVFAQCSSYLKWKFWGNNELVYKHDLTIRVNKSGWRGYVLTEDSFIRQFAFIVAVCWLYTYGVDFSEFQ